MQERLGRASAVQQQLELNVKYLALKSLPFFVVEDMCVILSQCPSLFFSSVSLQLFGKSPFAFQS